MRRREFIAALGGAAAWPVVARAQQGERMRRIGVHFASAATDPEAQADLSAFKEGLQRLGWTLGSAVVIDERWAAGSAERAQSYARELVGLRPDVLLTTGLAPAKALRQQTNTIPIIFARVSDPVGQGLVASLARPGANVTGFTNFEVTIGSKWLQILKQIAPATTRVIVMANPKTSAFEAYVRLIARSAGPFAVTPVAQPVYDVDGIAAAVTNAAAQPGSAAIVLPDGFMVAHRAAVVGLIAKAKLPAVYPLRPFAADGGLVSYGVDTQAQLREAASYVDRIFKGAKVAELPVQEPSKFQLVVNLKTAKAIGLTVPESLLYLADEVIE